MPPCEKITRDRSPKTTVSHHIACRFARNFKEFLKKTDGQAGIMLGFVSRKVQLHLGSIEYPRIIPASLARMATNREGATRTPAGWPTRLEPANWVNGLVPAQSLAL
jgi:hypothetical protein